MIRSVLVVFSVFCAATLMSQLLGMAILWNRGQLNKETLNDIRMILAGQTLDENDDDESEKARRSADEVMNLRIGEIFDLESRKKIQITLMKMVDDESRRLSQEKIEFESRKKAFEETLALARDNLASEATEQARGVLLAFSPEIAVRQLMELDLEENIVLMKGLPDKKIAKILDQFSAASGARAAAQLDRGHAIYKALTKGKPERKVIENALKEQQQKDQPAETTAKAP